MAQGTGRLIGALVFGVAGVAILISLGVWQMQRLEWKRGILSEIESMIDGAAQPLPAEVSPSEHKYLPVNLTGTFGENVLRVLVSVKQRGAGYRVVSDFQTDDGRRILVDRGFVPVADDIPNASSEPISLLGNLHWPDDRTSSTPANDWVDNVFFARDIDEMAAGLKTEPLLVVARRINPPEPGLTPMPVSTQGIPNDHLQYAITWFSLAVVWLLMTILYIRRGRRQESASA